MKPKLKYKHLFPYKCNKSNVFFNSAKVLVEETIKMQMLTSICNKKFFVQLL